MYNEIVNGTVEHCKFFMNDDNADITACAGGKRKRRDVLNDDEDFNGEGSGEESDSEESDIWPCIDTICNVIKEQKENLAEKNENFDNAVGINSQNILQFCPDPSDSEW